MISYPVIYFDPNPEVREVESNDPRLRVFRTKTMVQVNPAGLFPILTFPC